MPIVTEPLPPDTWTDADFEPMKSQIDEAWEEYDQLTTELINSGYVRQGSCTVVAKHGHTNIRRTLLGGRTWGSSDETIWASKPWIQVSRPGIPDPWGGKESKVHVAPLMFETCMAYLERLTADLKEAKQNRSALADRSPVNSFQR